jgi:hypothetical protein
LPFYLVVAASAFFALMTAYAALREPQQSHSTGHHYHPAPRFNAKSVLQGMKKAHPRFRTDAPGNTHPSHDGRRN